MIRQIGRSEHIANTEHFCSKCCRYIFPGDMYERVVKLDSRPRLIPDHEKLTLTLIKRSVFVDKYHRNPECDYPWEDEDSFEYQHERELEEERRQEGELETALDPAI